MVYDNSTQIPRQELALVMVQGRGFNQQNIWDKVLPSFALDKRTAHLISLNISTGELLRIVDKVRAPGTNFERITATFGDQTITLLIRGEEAVVPDEVEADFDGYFSTEALMAQTAEDKLELTQEYLTANAIFSTASFGSAINSAVAYTVANLATISFIADMYTMFEQVRSQGEQPNTIIIPELVYQRIRQCPLVTAFVRGILMAQVTVNTNTIQEAFADEGITQVLVARSRYNAAATNATPSITLIWSSAYIWVGRCGNKFADDEGGVETVEGVGCSPFWSSLGELQVYTYRQEPLMSNIVRAITSSIPYIANSNAGALLSTQYA